MIALQYLLLQGFTAAGSVSESALAGMIARIAAQYGVYTLLLAPSLNYACLYLLVFYLNIAQLFFRTEFRNSKMIILLLGLTLSVFSSVFYYIYQ